MIDPMQLDKENVKLYKIPKEVELHPRQKLAFLEEQLNQIRAMHWRARVDMLHAARLQEEENPPYGKRDYQTWLHTVTKHSKVLVPVKCWLSL